MLKKKYTQFPLPIAKCHFLTDWLLLWGSSFTLHALAAPFAPLVLSD